MQRIVVLIDGTWDKEGSGAASNVAKLDANYSNGYVSFISPVATNGTRQLCLYHSGVGTSGDLAKRLLGGAIGLGLKRIIQDCYNSIIDNFAHGDELYLFGFSRGAYAVRALAGLIEASGIQRQQAPEGFAVAWDHYRIKPLIRNGHQPAGSGDKAILQRYEVLGDQNYFHKERRIKCVGVWDTVGSYGIPAGFGLAPLARYYTLLALGFHDTRFGDHIDVGLHAVSIDERRRPFVPTFWTAPKGTKPKGHVEQTWFAGVHCNIGGGYADCGLSDRALILMIARAQALTDLEFNVSSVRSDTKPLDGRIEDSSRGWPVSQIIPYQRKVLASNAIEHGLFFNSENAGEEHINETVQWSVISKRGRKGVVFDIPNTLYEPPNLLARIPAEKIANMTSEEQVLAGA
jgi:uncharacterized protein (DUF2235 family)